MPSSDIKSVLPSAVTIYVGETEHELHPLTAGDWSKMESFVISERVNTILTAQRHIPISDDVRAKGLADVVGQTVDMSHILRSPTCQLYAVWLSLKGGGRPKWTQFRDTFDALDFGAVVDTVMIISGVIGGKSADDPLDQAGESSTTTTEMTD